MHLGTTSWCIQWAAHFLQIEVHLFRESKVNSGFMPWPSDALWGRAADNAVKLEVLYFSCSWRPCDLV